MEKLEQTPMSEIEKKLNAEIRTIRAQWIGVKEDNESLLTQIEYLNKDAKESRDKIMKLEFQLKKAWNEAIDACIEIFRSAPWDQNIIPLVEKLKHKRP